MNTELELLLLIGIVLSTILLSIKSFIRRDLSMFAAIIPRIYLLGAIIYDLSLQELHVGYLHLGIAIVFFGDCISSLFILLGKRIKTEQFAIQVLHNLQNLSEKYSFIVNTTPIGIFTINEVGRFEFINKTLANILETDIEHLIGASMYDFLPEDLKETRKKELFERVQHIDHEASFKTAAITAKGNLITIQIHSKTTNNGHRTITGSVIKL